MGQLYFQDKRLAQLNAICRLKNYLNDKSKNILVQSFVFIKFQLLPTNLALLFSKVSSQNRNDPKESPTLLTKRQ